MKISQRLQTINQMVTEQYDHIWDCCCDHGLLGMLLLEKQAAPQVHFVDSAAPLMHSLEQQLTRFFPRQRYTNPVATNINERTTLLSQWQVHCIDAENLPLALTDKAAKHLIIIAGVGGELLVELVRGILAKHCTLVLEFILCPVHHNYYVRQSLAALGLGLLSEHLLQENRRFYEILHVSKPIIETNASRSKTDMADGNDTQLERICASGSLMWQGLDMYQQQQAQQYLQQTLAHYQRIPLQQLPQKMQILADYHAVLASLLAQPTP